MKHLLPETVQHFLNELDHETDFTVVYTVKDGSQRRYTGCLMPSDNRSANVPFMTIDSGVKSFNVSRVLWIDFAEVVQDLESL